MCGLSIIIQQQRAGSSPQHRKTQPKPKPKHNVLLDRSILLLWNIETRLLLQKGKCPEFLVDFTNEEPLRKRHWIASVAKVERLKNSHCKNEERWPRFESILCLIC